MAKKICMALTLLFFCGALTAQTIEQLKTNLDDTKKEITRLMDERDKLEKEIENQSASGWVFGGTGGVVFNSAGFSNWVNGGDNSSTIAGSLNLYANNNQDRYFWNNTGQFKLGYVNNATGSLFDSGIEVPDTISLPSLPTFDNWQRNLDEIYITSLFGYKLSEQLAVSVLGDLRSTFKDFADPGYVSFGAGLTWTPNNKLKVVVHPATWRGLLVQTDAKKVGFGWDVNDLEPNLKGEFGAKIMLDYKDEVARNLFWNSNLSAFFSYTDFNNPEVQWTNTFSYTLNKFISLTLEHALRYYKPETNAAYLNYLVNESTRLNEINPLIPIFDPTNPDIDTNGIIEAAENAGNLSYFQNRYLITLGITTAF